MQLLLLVQDMGEICCMTGTTLVSCVQMQSMQSLLHVVVAAYLLKKHEICNNHCMQWSLHLHMVVAHVLLLQEGMNTYACRDLHAVDGP